MFVLRPIPERMDLNLEEFLFKPFPNKAFREEGVEELREKRQNMKLLEHKGYLFFNSCIICSRSTFLWLFKKTCFSLSSTLN